MRIINKKDDKEIYSVQSYDAARRTLHSLTVVVEKFCLMVTLSE